MEFKGLKVDFAGIFLGMSQLAMGIAAVITAWKGVHHAKKRNRKNESSS